MEISFLTEGSAKLGLGHISRCCALAQKLYTQKDVDSIKFIINGDHAAKNFAKNNGFNAVILNWANNITRTLGLIKKSRTIIVDSYVAGKVFYRKIYFKRNYGQLVVIDDYNRLNYDADIVINPSIYGSNLKYTKKYGTRYLLGKEYIILRNDFHRPPPKNINSNVDKVLIYLGGGIKPIFIEKIIKVLLPYNFNVDIVGYTVEKLSIARHKNIKFYSCISTLEMRRLMLKSDICISAGGQTLHELAVCGMPTLALCTADNQLLNLKYWQKSGFIEYIGWFNQKDIENKINKALVSLFPYKKRLERSKIGRRIVDGFGVDRIVNEILPVKNRIVKLSLARKEDCFDILKWRNHIKVRRWCKNNRELPDRDKHRRWFYSCLKDPRVKMFIVRKDHSKAGVIRFNEGHMDVIANVNLNPEFLYKGIGANLIKEGTRLMLRKLKSDKPIVARIKKDNHASCKAFEKAGYIYRKSFQDRSSYLTLVYSTEK